MNGSEVQIVLGIGAGQCGLGLLMEILQRQPGTKFTYEEKPYLPWESQSGESVIHQRIDRWKSAGNESVVGDMAHFYLPYVEDAIGYEPGIRIVCLKREREEFIAAFRQTLDEQMPLPINHWCTEPAMGWHHDPLRTFTYPQYDAPDRLQGLKRYWEDYYARAEELAARFSENIILVDANELTNETGVRGILDFIGMPANQDTVLTGRPPLIPPLDKTDTPFTRYPNQHDPRKCAVLVPFSGTIHQGCEVALKELEKRGYRVFRISGYAAIDQARNQLATDALIEGFEETLWIDSDIEFHPDDVEKLRRHDLPIVCGIYPQKAKRMFACEFLPETRHVTFGSGGGLIEILYAATGFLLIHRNVYSVIQKRMALPICNDRFNRPTIPFFRPMVRQIDDGYWYLAEDFSFCERARNCGFNVFADTSIRLWHVGNYPYGWEDAGLERIRHDSFKLNAVDAF